MARKKKQQPFRNGLFLGLVWPILLLGGVTALIYRYTKSIPFPVRRTEGGDLVVGLISPAEITTYWSRWWGDLAPLKEQAQRASEELRGGISDIGE